MQVPSESFSVLMEESNGALHLYLDGWLDASAVPALLRSVMRGRPGDVVLDIGGLDHIDGAGWLGVISCEQRVTNWGGRLRIDHGIRKILELASSAS
jgi:hypothetical protein